MNAGRLQVTQDFLQEWLTVPSAALDIWHSGTVTLDASPPLDNYRFLASFSTFVGIGIIGCSVPEIPHQFLRDRMVASLRIKNSVVNIMRKGFLHNIHQMRYLVLEDSVVDTVEGPVATEGYMTLGQRLGHTWNGLIISKTTIRRLGAGAFNLTHEGRESDDTCKADVTNCRLGTVGTGAMTVAGNIAVTIKGNHFQRLESKAFNIDVKNELKFEENVALSLDVNALEGLICHNLTSLEKNTAYLDKIPNTSVSPFHISCGNPQVFMVVSAAKPEEVNVTSKATWVLLAILLFLVVAALLYCYGLSQRKCQYRKGNTFHFFNGLMSSEERLCTGPEVNAMNEVSVEGLSNPLYERREPTSSL
ncbi:uncharacterized protein [Panulirus ornatus]|uniref:uncharacterized protein n=1 Tax=Panulirus ornatus TaxID=150431 RepID=UPI003A87C756